MKLSEWSKQPKLVAWAMKTFSSSEGREFLKMLETDHPRLSVLAWGATADDKVTKLGQNDGYQLALNNIEKSCKLEVVKPEVEATYGAEQPKEFPEYTQPKNFPKEAMNTVHYYADKDLRCSEVPWEQAKVESLVTLGPTWAMMEYIVSKQAVGKPPFTIAINREFISWIEMHWPKDALKSPFYTYVVSDEELGTTPFASLEIRFEEVTAVLHYKRCVIQNPSIWTIPWDEQLRND